LVPASWRKSSSRATWVHIKRAVRKASNFPTCFNGPSDGSVRDLGDYALCCTSFSKSPASGRRCRFVFHVWRALQEILMPSHVCSSGHLTPAMSPPSPLSPYHPYAPTALISRCADRSVVSPSLPQPMSPCFHNVGAEREREQPFSLLPFRLINAIAPSSVTQLHATEVNIA
jgi:hypothetical protein